MPTAMWTRIVIALAAGFWFVAALLLDVPVNDSWMKPLGVASSAVVALLLLFDLFVWRWLPLALVRRPILRGTWKARAVSSFEVDGKPVEWDCFIVIRQTYSSISVEMLFPKSESNSSSANLLVIDGRYELWYTYTSEAHVLEREGNPPHRGAAKFRVSGDPRLEGDYWTDRRTVGRIEADLHSIRFASNYPYAVTLFD